MIEQSKSKDNKLANKYFQEFYISYAADMIAFARRFVDETTAEDIVHDIFLNIWDQKSTIMVEKELHNYLLSMVKNACFDYLKHKKVSETFLSKAEHQLKIEELEYYEYSENEYSENHNLQAIYSSIEKLPPKCKVIFEKAYIEKQKSAEIAEEMNISVRTVETHVYNALKIIRNNLKVLKLIFAIIIFTTSTLF